MVRKVRLSTGNKRKSLKMQVNGKPTKISTTRTVLKMEGTFELKTIRMIKMKTRAVAKTSRRPVLSMKILALTETAIAQSKTRMRLIGSRNQTVTTPMKTMLLEIF